MSILPYGVMVAREILVLLVWVRALVRQQKLQSKFFGCSFFRFCLQCMFPAFGFSHPCSTMIAPESGSFDRRPTTITIGNGSSDRMKKMINPEKKSSHRRTWMSTFLFVE